MKNMILYKSIRGVFFASAVILFCGLSTVFAARQEKWKRQKVDLNLGNGDRIRAIIYPEGKAPPMRARGRMHRPKHGKKSRPKDHTPDNSQVLSPTAPTTASRISLNVIDSPPIDGFIPWIAVITTDSREEELVLEAVPENHIVGNYTAANIETDFTIGILDTGASALLMGNAAAVDAGLFSPNPENDYITDNIIPISGVTGSVLAWVSYPIGVFVDGLSALEPNNPGNPEARLTDTSDMVGETNVSIIVGAEPSPDDPDLPTAIGTPLCVYYTTVIRNDQQITVVHDGNDFTAPNIHIYEHDDGRIPQYPNKLPLELRPLGGISVQYMPGLDFIAWFEDPFNIDLGTPQIPSIIMGNLSQSTFFVHSVDLTEGTNKAFDKNRYMLDTGAQVSVIGSRIGARLGLDPASADFQVVIEGVTGETTTADGFYIDSLEMPALGQWLRFTNVPMILLDIFSPEGGTLDGIIGMNLFVDYNMVLRGGGLFLQGDPAIEFELIDTGKITADIAPPEGDGVVNLMDLAVFSKAWQTDTNSLNWNLQCDLAPLYKPDGVIDALDLAVLADHWLQGV
jgi:predicted aspartyl protease